MAELGKISLSDILSSMPDNYPFLFRSFLDRSHTVYFSYQLATQRLVYVSPAYAQVWP